MIVYDIKIVLKSIFITDAFREYCRNATIINMNFKTIVIFIKLLTSVVLLRTYDIKEKQL